MQVAPYPMHMGGMAFAPGMHPGMAGGAPQGMYAPHTYAFPGMAMAPTPYGYMPAPGQEMPYQMYGFPPGTQMYPAHMAQVGSPGSMAMRPIGMYSMPMPGMYSQYDPNQGYYQPNVAMAPAGPAAPPVRTRSNAASEQAAQSADTSTAAAAAAEK